jgi:hypothetical protein
MCDVQGQRPECPDLEHLSTKQPRPRDTDSDKTYYAIPRVVPSAEQDAKGTWFGGAVVGGCRTIEEPEPARDERVHRRDHDLRLMTQARYEDIIG